MEYSALQTGFIHSTNFLEHLQCLETGLGEVGALCAED